jgi:hypothetical protein
MNKNRILPAIIQRRVNQILLEANPTIIERALEKFDEQQRIYLNRIMYKVNMEWHTLHRAIGRSHGCGCDYCISLSKYVGEKIREHRLAVRMDRWWYEPYSGMDDQKALREARENWKRLKLEKNQIKQLVGL